MNLENGNPAWNHKRLSLARIIAHSILRSLQNTSRKLHSNSFKFSVFLPVLKANQILTGRNKCLFSKKGIIFGVDVQLVNVLLVSGLGIHASAQDLLDIEGRILRTAEPDASEHNDSHPTLSTGGFLHPLRGIHPRTEKLPTTDRGTVQFM